MLGSNRDEVLWRRTLHCLKSRNYTYTVCTVNLVMKQITSRILRKISFAHARVSHSSNSLMHQKVQFANRRTHIRLRSRTQTDPHQSITKLTKYRFSYDIILHVTINDSSINHLYLLHNLYYIQRNEILYNYFIPFCETVKPITPRLCG